MNNHPSKDRKLIEKFMKQSLDNREYSLFQKKMQKEDFAKQVAEESVRLSARAKLQSELKGIHKEVISTQTNIRRRITIAAVFGLFILSTSVYYFFTRDIPSVNSEVVFAKYFEPYPDVFAQRSTRNSYDQKLQAALEAYDKQQYTEANELFAAMLEKEVAKNSHTSFYYAMSLLANKQTEEAIPLLENILANKFTFLQSETMWYLALAYLRTDQKEKARKILLDFQNESNGFKKEESKLLLEEI